MKSLKTLKNLSTQNKEISSNITKLLLLKSRVSLKNNFKMYKFFNKLSFNRFLSFYAYKNLLLKKHITISPIRQPNLFFIKSGVGHRSKTEKSIKAYLNFYTAQKEYEKNKPFFLKTRIASKFDLKKGSSLVKLNSIPTSNLNQSFTNLKLYLHLT